jgi:hypothetical protein
MVYVPREILQIILRERRLLIWETKFRRFYFPVMELTLNIREIESWLFLLDDGKYDTYYGVDYNSGDCSRWYEWRQDISWSPDVGGEDNFDMNNFDLVEVVAIDVHSLARESDRADSICIRGFY